MTATEAETERHERWIYVYGWAAFQRIDLIYVYVYVQIQIHTLCSKYSQTILVHILSSIERVNQIRTGTEAETGEGMLDI